MHNISKVAIFTCVMTLAACGPSDPAIDSSAKPATVAASDADPVEAEATPTTGVWFEPAGLSACGTGGEVVTVHWDVSSMAGVTGVEVVPIEKDAPAGVFATSGVQGSKDTGAWMQAGGTMAVLNAANGEELARASVGSIPCAD